jgi:hypothetical protein
MRLIEEVRVGDWEDHEELKRRIHLIARKYSLDGGHAPVVTETASS